MLRSYQQQAHNNTFNRDMNTINTGAIPARLTLSYDLNNYQSLLSHLQNSEDPRWILFIAPPGKPNVQFLQQAGINKSRIITLSKKQLDDPEKLFKDALSSNNYAAVIHWTNRCNSALIDDVNQLTIKSKTHCFIYCTQ